MLICHETQNKKYKLVYNTDVINTETALFTSTWLKRLVPGGHSSETVFFKCHL